MKQKHSLPKLLLSFENQIEGENTRKQFQYWKKKQFDSALKNIPHFGGTNVYRLYLLRTLPRNKFCICLFFLFRAKFTKKT